MVNYNENVYVRRGVDGRSHIPALPFWMAIIRVVQLFPGYNMSFFTFAWTVLFMLYIFLTPLVYPKFYLSYAHLGLEFLTVIFWLTTFALLADECKYWVAFQDSYSSRYSQIYDDDADKYVAASKTSRAATGIAAITWLLFMVTFGFVVYFWNKHRTESGETGLPFGSRRNDVEGKQNENVEIHNVQQPQPQPYPQGQPQPQYAQGQPQPQYQQTQYQQPQYQGPTN